MERRSQRPTHKKRPAVGQTGMRGLGTAGRLFAGGEPRCLAIGSSVRDLSHCLLEDFPSRCGRPLTPSFELT